METCKAIIQEGTRKGECCKFPPGETNAYCGRHQRNYEYDILIQAGKRPCRFFFRGCNTTLKQSEKSPSCISCRQKRSNKTKPCGHEGCIFKTDNTKYCKKHERDRYYDEEKEKGIKYCDIARGCFTILEGTASKCSVCLSKANISEKQRIQKRQILHTALNDVKNTIQQICVGCGKDFEKYMTRYNRPSKLCKHCNETQKVQDEKRKDRIRNYREENFKNIPLFFKEYVKGAYERGYSMELQFEDFKEMVLKPCYYCTSRKENEVNGIDRVDNSKGYTKENCVSCCQTCNRMKLIYHPAFFITKCKIISKQIAPLEDFFTTWKEHYSRNTKKNYKTFKHGAEIVRNLNVNITEDDWNRLTQEPCHYCGYTNKNGIGLDRIDNSVREYRLENVKPCCGSCNLIKGELSYQDFLDKANQIAEAWNDTSCFDTIEKPKDAFKEANRKVETQAPDTETRKSWKALGVYYSVLSGCQDFYETQKDILSKDEFNMLSETVKQNAKEHCVPEIQKLLVKLKKRRQRNK
jgi:hypothetical protein